MNKFHEIWLSDPAYAVTDKTTESTERLEVDDDLDLLDSDTGSRINTKFPNHLF